MKKHIPNSLTATNLFLGCVAVLFIVQGHIWPAAICVGGSLIADFFDGFAARILKVSSPIGKELDSLADMVTFGFVPGLILARLIRVSGGYEFLPTNWEASWEVWSMGIGFLVTVFSALRLAKFNLDERQSDAFYGVPTPANTMLIFSLWIIVSLQPDHWISATLNRPWVWMMISLLSAYWLIMDVKLLALKFKSFAFRPNLFRYVLIGLSIILIISFQYVAVPFIFLLYLALSLIANQVESSDKGNA
ncbi:CDP-alcohol phosphatidyltransferase family protein [Pontibacter sp. G13]|uniref:CDP-alcohol phosphatidyltransferase family protein n=1 Tax=Pontibacter sp. G13 TaxID=3074898 RepID=UPI002889D2C0|nr:CDP-alcohol phosphatidyltransferase family protein [Pontibacter sp. G13]WNJ16208.1 CDP-alcohol phosphatidyltransferase family protein [Pontibacter sp. G13]